MNDAIHHYFMRYNLFSKVIWQRRALVGFRLHSINHLIHFFFFASSVRLCGSARLLLFTFRITLFLANADADGTGRNTNYL